jgi:hypothetical protein
MVAVAVGSEPGGTMERRRWRARVLASLVLAVGLIGVGEAPAKAAPRSPHSIGLPADDAPKPDDVEPFVPQLIDFGLLRDTLREEFPNTFAGLVNNGNDTLTVYETRTDKTMREWITRWFQDAVAEKGRDVDAKLIPRVTYRPAGRSLDSLFAMREWMMGAKDMLRGRGIGLETVGIQDGSNKLVVGVSTPPDAALPVLEAIYGRGTMRVIPWDLRLEADRWNDSAPWNGGDQLVSEGGVPTGCTSGFGVHDSSGNHYLTTAGHCNNHFWWNTFAGFPIRNDDTFVGLTSGAVWNGVYLGFRVDTQKVLTNGSSSIVWTGSASRRFISAPLDVAQGDPTCIEGSFSLTKCGSIWATDFGEGGTQYVVDVGAGGATTFGDSGAPSWRNSPFGPLAQGTHVGSLSSSLKVELNIFAVLFFNDVHLNTIFDP